MTTHEQYRLTNEVGGVEQATSAISWPAIFAGAVSAAALTVVLLVLGAGFGFAAISPWPGAGASALSLTVTAAIWLIVTQWLSAAFGGFITGRLRTIWTGTHTHEVFFRDTAHGFLAWALASLIGAAILGGAVAATVRTGTQAAASAGAAAAAAPMALAQQYGVESLFRGEKPELASTREATAAETTHILAMGVSNGGLSPADRTYLSNLIATRTGLSQPDAQKRVDDVVALEDTVSAKLREAADAARKSASRTGFLTALSMLIGALIASAAAALGGSMRDEQTMRGQHI